MNAGNLHHLAFDSITDYVASLDELCGLAKQSLIIFEKDFDHIGFNAQARHDTLRQFLLSSKKVDFRLLAHDVGPLVRYCPRLMTLSQQFGHLMQIRQTPANLKHLTLPFAVADNQHIVRRFHFDQPAGIFAKNDPEGALVLKSKFEEMWECSRPSAVAGLLNL